MNNPKQELAIRLLNTSIRLVRDLKIEKSKLITGYRGDYYKVIRAKIKKKKAKGTMLTHDEQTFYDLIDYLWNDKPVMALEDKDLGS